MFMRQIFVNEFFRKLEFVIDCRNFGMKFIISKLWLYPRYFILEQIIEW